MPNIKTVEDLEREYPDLVKEIENRSYKKAINALKFYGDKFNKDLSDAEILMKVQNIAHDYIK